MLKENSKYAIFKHFGEPETFKCDGCKRVFPKGWSDEDALAEMRERFPGVEPTDVLVLCDGCVGKVKIKPEYDREW